MAEGAPLVEGTFEVQEKPMTQEVAIGPALIKLPPTSRGYPGGGAALTRSG